MAEGSWERCVREVTLSADPETVGSVGQGWGNLSSGLTQLRDALVGRSFVGPIATGQERPHVGGLPGMLAGWKGSGGDAYREHLGQIGKQIEDLITDATNVSGALGRIETDIRKAVATIPVPLMDDFGINNWSLPNGTELDDARDGESASGFLAALRKDYQSNPGSYADGAFRDKADDLEATMKVDGQADDHKRGGWWDTKSHLDNWYKDNQQAANVAMSPLPAAVYTERPKLVVGEAPPPEIPEPPDRISDDLRTDDRVPSNARPNVSDIGGGGGFDTGGGADVGSKPPGIGADITGGPTSKGGPFSPPPTSGLGDGSTGGGAGSLNPPPTGSGYPGLDDGYSTGLAGAAPSSIGGGYGGAGGGLGGANLGSAGLGGAGGGIGGGVGAGGGIGSGGGGLGAAGVGGVGGIPGMVGGGNGKVPPMTSAANALRAATGAGAGGAGLAGGARGGAGMGGAGMGGGMMGGAGGAGHGGGGTGSEHSSWLTEDDDPWGPGDGASPGILR